jgi:hypothetical protein
MIAGLYLTETEIELASSRSRHCSFLKVRSASSSKRDSCFYSELLHISQDSMTHAKSRPPAALVLYQRPGPPLFS